MASKKDIKKDINFLAEEVIDTCFLHYYLKQNNEEERLIINQIIEDTVSLRNELLYKINHTDEKPEDMSVKAWFSEIFNKMVNHADEVFGKLEKIES